MPYARVEAAAVTSFGQQLVTVRAGDIVDGDLAAFLLDPSSGVACVEVDPAGADVAPVVKRARAPKAGA